MWSFTDEGRRVAETTCPTSGSGKHLPDPTAASKDTFFCKFCGAIPMDSVWYDMDERYRHVSPRRAQGPDDR